MSWEVNRQPVLTDKNKQSESKAQPNLAQLTEAEAEAERHTQDTHSRHRESEKPIPTSTLPYPLALLFKIIPSHSIPYPNCPVAYYSKDST